MAIYKLENNVYTTLNTSISNIDNNIVINKADSPFNSPPSLSLGETGIITIVDSTKNPKKIEIINYSNLIDNGNGTITLKECSRGQNDTIANNFASGAFIFQSVTENILSSLADISISSNLTSDHEYSGIVSIDLVKENVSFGDVLYWSIEESGYKKAIAVLLEDKLPLPGEVIALESASSDQTCSVLQYGYIRNNEWSWRLTANEEGPGNILFLSESYYGTMTQDIPTTLYNICGLVKSRDIIKFAPSNYVDLRQAMIE